MEITLQMIDEVISRTGVKYEKAVEALRATNGNVVEAILMLERESDDKPKEVQDEFYEKGLQVVGKIKDLVTKGNNIKVKVKQKDETIMEIPATIGVVGTVIAPYLTVVGAAACLATRCSIEIENKNIKKSEEDCD